MTNEVTQADGAPLVRQVRPGRWRCQACDWIGSSSNLLTAPNPFDPSADCWGCPNCKAIDDLLNVCDEPGCNRPSSCGWPGPDGYRVTCGIHHVWA